MRDIIENKRDVVPEGPETLNAAFDRSCNLSCPSCRTEHIIEAESQSQIEELQKRLENETFDNLGILYITGSGDAFGSPFFMRWLRTLDVTKRPKLRIHLQTNAQLWTPQIWAKIPPEVRERIPSAEISIDAASAPTYALNRRGGEWSTLLNNLEFIAGLRAGGPLIFLQLDMVVQENNFSEMPAFVELGKRYGADRVFFTHLTSWGTFGPEELQQRSVHVPSHKRHQDLLAVLRDPRLGHPIVDMGNLMSLRAQPAAATL
jgi:MoaA/NifB/PqqE/SkfB family radical SAM enzyme